MPIRLLMLLPVDPKTPTIQSTDQYFITIPKQAQGRSRRRLLGTGEGRPKTRAGPSLDRALLPQPNRSTAAPFDGQAAATTTTTRPWRPLRPRAAAAVSGSSRPWAVSASVYLSLNQCPAGPRSASTPVCSYVGHLTDHPHPPDHPTQHNQGASSWRSASTPRTRHPTPRCMTTRAGWGWTRRGPTRS